MNWIKTIRLMCSGALFGLALAGVLGIDASSTGVMTVASLAGAGAALLAMKSMATA